MREKLRSITDCDSLLMYIVLFVYAIIKIDMAFDYDN